MSCQQQQHQRGQLYKVQVTVGQGSVAYLEECLKSSINIKIQKQYTESTQASSSSNRGNMSCISGALCPQLISGQHQCTCIKSVRVRTHLICGATRLHALQTIGTLSVIKALCYFK